MSYSNTIINMRDAKTLANKVNVVKFKRTLTKNGPCNNKHFARNTQNNNIPSMLKLFHTCIYYLRIDCYFRAHMEYKRPDGGLKIP